MIGNTCHFMGNIGPVPEMRYMPDETPVLSVGLAIDGKKKDDEPTWANLVLFGRRAESFAKYAEKGRRLAVICEFRLNKWTDNRTGETRSRPEFVVREWRFLDARRSENAAPEADDNTTQGDSFEF